ncbi:hypothetical protein H0H93_001192 [Arthromyces matolae]|nr:hypothetical protein H0H93_001192 [Arthromyces matolae]
MPEYVYALHDFAPENEDEVAFNAGERIEVVEKDDLYGDGWWKGRNLAGKVGLFPQSYTTSAPPPGPVAQSTSTSSTATEVPIGDNNIGHPHLQVLQEEEESETLLNTNTTTNIVAPVPQYIPPALVIDEDNEDKELSSAEPSPEQDSSTHKHERTMSSGHEVMKATMTDVQKAIEQLGRSHAAGDESRSFSFASFTGDNTEGETDTDYDMSDIDASSPNSAGESWHKGARTKLAEKARRAVEEAEKLEALMNSAPGRTTAPPIDVELSDESDGEEEYTSHSGIFTRAHPHIPEEEEEEEEKSTAKDSESMMTGTTGTHSKVPSDQHEDVEPRTAKAAQSSFPVSVFQPPPPSSPAPQSQTQQESKRSSGYNEGYRESFIELPSSMPSTPGEQSRHNSVASAPSLTTSASAFSHPPHTSSTLVEDHHENGVGNGLKDVKEKEGAERVKEKKHPTEWDVAEVVEWLKGRGFDQDVCEKFTDTTGSICSGLHLMRIAEGIKGKPSSPPVLDSAFPQSPTDDKLDGLFQLFDFLLDNDVKMGSVSINDVRQGKRDKILQLLKALKSWEDKRRAIAGSIVSTSPMSSGGFIAPMVWS